MAKKLKELASDLMRSDNIGFNLGYYPMVNIPRKLDLFPFNTYVPSVTFKKTKMKNGGSLPSSRQYDDLSLREKQLIFHTAVKYGIHDIPTIKAKYNKFAKGGPIELPEVEVTARLHTPVDKRDDSNTIRERLYLNIEPKSYDNMASRVTKALAGINTRTGEVTPELEAYWAYYMLLNPELVSLYLEKSPLRPTKGNAKYDTVVRPKAGISDEVFNAAINNIPIGSNMQSSLLFPDVTTGLGDYTIGHGLDKYGKYISIYDDWDLSTGAHNTGDMSLGIGTPFTVYDRRYYK